MTKKASTEYVFGKADRLKVRHHSKENSKISIFDGFAYNAMEGITRCRSQKNINFLPSSISMNDSSQSSRQIAITLSISSLVIQGNRNDSESSI